MMVRSAGRVKPPRRDTRHLTRPVRLGSRPMARTLFTGGLVYDGTTARPAEGDVVVEDGRIIDVGPGLDGDEVVDCAGGFLSPGFFDSHVHVVMDTPNFIEMIEDAFSLQFYKAAVNLRK